MAEHLTSQPYPKINSLYKRDQRGRIILGDYATDEIEYLAGCRWLWTEKVDGTNIRLTYDGSPTFRGNEHAYVQGRSDNAQIPPSLLVVLIGLMKDLDWAHHFPGATEDSRITLYGEGYGAGIQKVGVQYSAEKHFVLFDVSVGGKWLSRANVEDVASKMGLDVVPLVLTGSIPDAVEAVRTQAFTSRWPGVSIPEGLVGRPDALLFDRFGHRITTKVKWADVGQP